MSPSDESQVDLFEQTGVVAPVEESDDFAPTIFIGEEPLSTSATEHTECLFSEEEIIPWRAEWQNMPEFNNADQSPQFSVIINFTCAADVEAFGVLIGQPLKASHGRQLQSLWHPEQEIGRLVNTRYIEAAR